MAVRGWLISCAKRRGHLAERGESRHVGHFRLQFLEPAFGELLVGQIANEAGEIVPLGGSQLADREVHREGRAVLALSHHDTADADDPALSGGEIALEVEIMLFAVRRWHQLADVSALNLVQGIAEQALRRRAEGLDAPLLVDDDHGVRYGLQDRPQPCLGRIQRQRHR